MGEGPLLRARGPAPGDLGLRRFLLDTGIAGDFICTVVSDDSDLAAVPGLAVENWAATR